MQQQKNNNYILVLVLLLSFGPSLAGSKTMLETIEINPATTADATVIWLHGLGADGHDFEPIVAELALPKSSAVRFIFPHAPTRAVTINNGYVMRAWYDIVQADLGSKQDVEGIRASQSQLEELIENEISRGIPTQRIILAGFSQGGVIAIQTALRFSKQLAGVMMLSAYVPLVDTLEAERHSANAAIPVFYAHGNNDDIIPISFAEASRDYLIKLGYRPEWHSYPMPHGVLPEEIDDIGWWLRKVLALD